MSYKPNPKKSQERTVPVDYCLHLPSGLQGFHNEKTIIKTSENGELTYCFYGYVDVSDSDRVCKCGGTMHIHDQYVTRLNHLNFGTTPTEIVLTVQRFFCPKCRNTHIQHIAFKAATHWITVQLLRVVCGLLSSGTYTLRQISRITGLGKNVVKAIDKERLLGLHTTENGTRLKKPERQAKYLAIDEFKLHRGHQYATHIIDLETGYILWIQKGKGKDVVHNFIDHAGLNWMKGVEAVSCDMNAGFHAAFLERCPHLRIVFDYFHVIKNFNEKVVNEVRKDEMERLYKEGNTEAASKLKHSRYILVSSRETLQKKDEKAEKEQAVKQKEFLFKKKKKKLKGGNEEKYNALIKENQLLLTIDLIKEKLKLAYKLTDETEMEAEITEIIDLCESVKNRHFDWFAKFLTSHFKGITAHAVYNISNGKMEGINQKIKTLRRHAYGYNDDDYFFLKLIDMSRL